MMAIGRIRGLAMSIVPLLLTTAPVRGEGATPVEIGATLIFVPAYTQGLSVLELTLWAQKHGFGDMAYIPAKPKPNTGVEA